MERMERLQLLLAYGFLSLFLCFSFLLTLSFFNFPFQPGSVLAVGLTLGIFSLSFFLSAKIVSKYMTFSSNDVHFILNLVFVIGLGLVALDMLWGGTKIATLFSNLSFLTVFLACTTIFLHPKTENEIIDVQPYPTLFYNAIVRTAQTSFRYTQFKWRSLRTRFAQTSRKSV